MLVSRDNLRGLDRHDVVESGTPSQHKGVKQVSFYLIKKVGPAPKVFEFISDLAKLFPATTLGQIAAARNN